MIEEMEKDLRLTRRTVATGGDLFTRVLIGGVEPMCMGDFSEDWSNGRAAARETKRPEGTGAKAAGPAADGVSEVFPIS